jgi:alpha-L-fucosidase 2
MNWKGGKLSDSQIKSLNGEQCILKTNDPVQIIGINSKAQKTNSGYITTFQTEKGKIYQVKAVQ